MERYGGDTISIPEMFVDYYKKNKNEETLRRHLRAPIAIRARRDLEKELQQRVSRVDA
jgi:hypothetical protein